MIKVKAPNKATVLVVGAGLVRLAAKEVRDLPDVYAKAALAEGCDVDGDIPDTVKASGSAARKNAEELAASKAALEKAETEKSETEKAEAEGERAAERLIQIRNVMQAMMDADDKSLLTADGLPRAKEVELRVGFDTDATEREAAWELLQGA